MVDTGHCAVDTGHCRTINDSEVRSTSIGEHASSARGRRAAPRRRTSGTALSHSRVVDAYHLVTTDGSIGAPRRHDHQSTRRPPSTTALGGVFNIGVAGGRVVNRGSNGEIRSGSSPRNRRATDSQISRRSSRHRQGALATASDVVETSSSVTLLRQLQARSQVATTREAHSTKKTSSMSKSAGTTYLSDVKKALSRHPDVYRKFVEVLKRYHEQRVRGSSCGGSSAVNRYDINGMNDDGENHDQDAVIDDAEDDWSSTGGELETIREMVELLKNRPQLVLAFNDYLPDGYRIRMFDESAYVIEHPHDSVVTGAGGISAGIGRLTVSV